MSLGSNDGGLRRRSGALLFRLPTGAGQLLTNLLFIGDIFASPGRGMVARHLPEIATAENIHLVIANGENAAGGFGITPALADEIFGYGVDVITTGNHVWDKK